MLNAVEYWFWRLKILFYTFCVHVITRKTIPTFRVSVLQTVPAKSFSWILWLFQGCAAHCSGVLSSLPLQNELQDDKGVCSASTSGCSALEEVKHGAASSHLASAMLGAGCGTQVVPLCLLPDSTVLSFQARKEKGYFRVKAKAAWSFFLECAFGFTYNESVAKSHAVSSDSESRCGLYSRLTNNAPWGWSG